MLSTGGIQQYPADLGAGNMVTQGHMAPQPMAHSGLDTLAEGSQYAWEQLQQQQQQQHQHPQHSQHPQQQHQNQQGALNGGASQAQQRPSIDDTGADGAVGGRRESSKGGKPAVESSQSVRRRISRACDQCNQLRTRCNGKQPCEHCVEFDLKCEYARERKKRGKASRKDLAAQQQQCPASEMPQDGKEQSPKSSNENESDEAYNESKQGMSQGIKRRRSSGEFQHPQLPPPRPGSMVNHAHLRQHSNGTTLPSMEQTRSIATHAMTEPSGSEHRTQTHAQQAMAVEHQPPGGAANLPTPRLPAVGIPERGVPVAMGDYGTMDDYHRSILHPAATHNGQNFLHSSASGMPNSMIQGGTITGYGESPYAVHSPQSQQGMHGPPFRIGESPLSAGFLGQSPAAGSPGWLSLPSPSAALYPGLQHTPANQTLRYPVLRPLLPHISAIIPIGLACDLLELYFTSSSSAIMQPLSPYILGYVFRKRSFLRSTSPRPCGPALLASMLWVAAQTSESAFLTAPPSARGKICQKLLELTVSLLKPLIHAPSDGTVNYGANTVINGVALGGFGVGLPGQAHEIEGGSPGATAALDDVATYIHLATVVSASEYKAASMRWWSAAWTLARELKLGRELPPNPENQDGPEMAEGQVGASGEAMSGQPQSGGQTRGFIAHEEEREERRRIWWLLYIVDRHLALCYNRPLFLLDAECDGLLQPENDVVWQAGEFYPGEKFAETIYYRRRGPCFECTGHSIFGFFMPLMTILGEIVDLNQQRNHPRFGLRNRSGNEWDEQAGEIAQQLEAYGRSLQDFDARHSHPQQQPQQQLPASATEATNPTDQPPLIAPTTDVSAATNPSNPAHPDAASPSGHSAHSSTRMTESILQTKVVVAYGTHLMHTLHILLNGKWDPISLLDDNDLWISTPSFFSATAHAVSAAEAINEILDYDPDLSFMPFFFGIYLLQGSFLLLLIADKLQGEASPSVVKACETIVRAHEACVVTLNTEYQRNFRKVMRSALAQVRGRMLEDFGEQQLRRREVLALYRWTGDGTGLAL